MSDRRFRSGPVVPRLDAVTIVTADETGAGMCHDPFGELPRSPIAVDALAGPLRGAVLLVERGIPSVVDIDTAARVTAAHRINPRHDVPVASCPPAANRDRASEQVRLTTDPGDLARTEVAIEAVKEALAIKGGVASAAGAALGSTPTTEEVRTV